MGKSLQDLYDEVVANESLVKEFLKTEKEGKIVEFAKNHGCSATAEEIKNFVESKIPSGGELSLEELDAVAGGGSKDTLSPNMNPNIIVINGN